jgi:hypothetical protein
VSEKSLRNQANHGFLAWAEDPRGRKGALPLERMRKRWRAGHSGYSFVAGQAKWKSRVIPSAMVTVVAALRTVLEARIVIIRALTSNRGIRKSCSCFAHDF